jgi:alpha-1,2-mannosyltransferase
VLIVTAGIAALALRIYQLSGRGELLGVTQYDDGPYFGSAVRLINGSLPYRDYIFVQPPGITLLMSQVALMTKGIGTAWGLAVGRVLTSVASAVTVVLAGLLVRHRGPLAVLVACGILLIHQDFLQAARTVLVEPWLALACLLGAVAVFDRDKLAGARRLGWGGVAFGIGGAIEPWAIVPVLVILALCLPGVRRAAVFAGGVAAGFLVPVLPFAALAPRQFYQGLVVAQVGYRAHAYRIGVWYRLQSMAGFSQTLTLSDLVLLLVALAVVIFVIGAIAVSAVVTNSAPPPLDRFAVLTAALVTLMFMWPPQFYPHYSAFLAPFFALAVALAAAELRAAFQAPAKARRARPWLARAATGLAGLAIVAFSAAETGHGPGAPVPADAERLIPPGSCVVTDQVSYLLLANRFVSYDDDCPQMVDGLGTDLALSHGLSPATGAGHVPAVAELWHDAFNRAQYVLLSNYNSRRIPWTPILRRYFHANFTRIAKTRYYNVYVRTLSSGASYRGRNSGLSCCSSERSRQAGRTRRLTKINTPTLARTGGRTAQHRPLAVRTDLRDICCRPRSPSRHPIRHSDPRRHPGMAAVLAQTVTCCPPRDIMAW